MRRVATFVALSAAALSIAAAWPADAAAEALEQELATLLIEHPQIRGAEKTLQASEQTIAIARAAYLPQVTLTGDYGPELIDSPPTRQAGDGADFLRSRTNATLNMVQRLFDGNATQRTRCARHNSIARSLPCRLREPGRIFCSKTIPHI